MQEVSGGLEMGETMRHLRDFAQKGPAFVIYVVLFASQMLAQNNQIPVDWPTRSAACGPKPTQSATQQFKVNGINDLPFAFRNGTRPQYVLKVGSTPASEVAPADFLTLFLGQQSAAQKAITRSAGQNRVPVPQCPSGPGEIAAALAALRASDLSIPAASPNGSAASLEESLGLSQSMIASNNALSLLQQAFSDPTCATVLQPLHTDPILQWIARVNSSEHSTVFSVSVNPNTNYKFDLSETWQGAPLTNATLTWRCGDADIFTLSVGPMFTTLPYRTYIHQKAPVPPGGSTTQDILGVNESTNVLGAALLNIHFPQIPHVPEWLGPAVSVGPVYAFGSAPSISKLGFFAGGSLHLYWSAFLTAGVHIGQFADYPTNLTKGSVIPNGFGDLNPVTRNTVRFAVGITFKTNTLKSSSQNSAPVNPGQPAGAQPVQPAAPQPAPQPQPQPQTQQQPPPQPQPQGTGLPTKTVEWTVMVYMNAKNNLECDGLDNFAQMATVGSSESTNVMVEMGRPQLVVKNGVPQSHYACGDKQPWDGVLRFRVAKDQVPLPGTALVNLGAADMGSAATLTDFVDWSKKNYPAKHYMLVIWNHGQGWRFQTARNQALKIAAAKTRGDVRQSADLQDAVAAEESRPVVGGYRSVSFDDDTGHFLYNRDIQDSLGKLLSGQKLDVIGFDACLMAMVETGYALRSIAQIMVGSEELVPGSGWDYGDFLGRLEPTAQQVDGKKMGELLVESYKQAYRDRLKATMSAVDLTQMDSFAGSLSGLAKALEGNLGSESANIGLARATCRNYGEDADFTNPIDIQQFAKSLVSTTKNRSILDSANGVIQFLDSGRLVYSNYASKRSSPGYGSFGVSIFFPQAKANFDSDRDKEGYLVTNQNHPVEFVQTQEWSRFIDKYLHLSQ